MKTYKKSLTEILQDNEFKKEYEDLQPEFDIIRAIADVRSSHNLNQKVLAERKGINQAGICKLEIGNCNPSLNLLKR